MRTFVLLAVRARPNAVITSASAKPGGPTATLSIVGLDKCIQAAAATVLVTATATIKTIQRQPLLTNSPHFFSDRPHRRAVASFGVEKNQNAARPVDYSARQKQEDR